MKFFAEKLKNKSLMQRISRIFWGSVLRIRGGGQEMRREENSKLLFNCFLLPRSPVYALCNIEQLSLLKDNVKIDKN